MARLGGPIPDYITSFEGRCKWIRDHWQGSDFWTVPKILRDVIDDPAAHFRLRSTVPFDSMEQEICDSEYWNQF